MDNVVYGTSLVIPKTDCENGEHHFDLLYKQPKAKEEDIFIFKCFWCEVQQEREGAKEYLAQLADDGIAVCLDCTPQQIDNIEK